MQIGVETSRAVENKRIFVVDDDEIIRAALQFMLHDENETHEVGSVQRAFEKLPDGKPDLLLLASSIVRSEGVGVLSDIKQKIPGAKILVIVESAGDEFGKQCLAAGAHSLLAKPLKLETVRERVDVLLGRRAGFALPLSVLKTS
ncbi:response regulator receiver protein [Methylocella silvestris BL2]|uniref:Response regulator receiver protein n=1 Tax=Methylocella silvestris (strain DSM 15510 / CIP 108128 / LMG 27833 / NCIMB 13906 / BL2) TaxID=395965 RepID=B8EJ26_METSB|nr:response regulator [Methylocella silvestris]ACK52518.1 response regulator receiver protein [Methylocella silvestris BL2]